MTTQTDTKTVLEVYDPAMCCSTGVCGPDVDDEIVDFANDVKWLKTQGVEVKRYNLGQEPEQFKMSCRF
ncbi:arsenic metallochaperone ArsD family protein [Rhodohalobacter sp.]|uniref:arsenic metallochaperone ArsD family protein n=1 Tax=Rhodohalobacter sp. TaxID=1974210 RepID=UPI002ACD9EBE|nr:arsenic metallochaperone ArsD family protein [Rhodohalobacter sp.]MDZ7756834.1 arsenic metallochaperone ArsD family protein [Rhodohalobacter sp.]